MPRSATSDCRRCRSSSSWATRKPGATASACAPAARATRAAPRWRILWRAQRRWWRAMGWNCKDADDLSLLWHPHPDVLERSRSAALPCALFWLQGDRGHPEIGGRSEEHTSELQSLRHLVCRLLLEKKQ